MSYINPSRALMGFGAFGDFTDESPCSTVPAGDPYRKPGNYCATPDGGYTTFNADGSTYIAPSAPASASSGSFFDKLGTAISGALTMSTASPYPVVAPVGMSTTTKVAIAGGVALLAVVLITRH